VLTYPNAIAVLERVLAQVSAISADSLARVELRVALTADLELVSAADDDFRSHAAWVDLAQAGLRAGQACPVLLVLAPAMTVGSARGWLVGYAEAGLYLYGSGAQASPAVLTVGSV
jgi:hypothetical protein